MGYNERNDEIRDNVTRILTSRGIKVGAVILQQ